MAAAISSSSLSPRFRIDYAPQRVFYHVGGADLGRMPVVEEIFRRILTPLYGDQTKAINQIKDGKDRSCFLLYEEENPVGVLVFKTILSNEFTDFGVHDSIEVKSLFVDNASQNSGKGLGSCLVDKLKDEVAKLGLGHHSIHVTVSETKQESLMFFRKKGFHIAHIWQDRYQSNTKEYLLSCPTIIQEVNALTRAFDQNLSLQGREAPAELVDIIHNAHLGDIHTLNKLSDKTFISGSKDNSLYKWNDRGEKIRVVDEVEPNYQNERNWITAVTTLNEEYWVSGARDGRLHLWKTNGDYVKQIKLKLPKFGQHVSHVYNTRRINCLAAGLSPLKPSLFVGFPTMFDEFNFIEGRTESSITAHKNDWVYCIHPITDKRLLTVTGCVIDLWEKNDQDWTHKEALLPEGKKVKVIKNNKTIWQRPFISSLTPLRSGETHFGITVFDGSVKVFDVAQKKAIKTWKGHQNRIWDVKELAPQKFATCGEDKTIKFWDQRQRNSVHTISDHIGQVTAILPFKENTLIAGTCPENPVTEERGAEIRFYDIRRFR